VKWFDSEKELWVMIATGAKNSRAFSAGADLKEWLELYISQTFQFQLVDFRFIGSEYY
jgi:enoyl-CoA hydratase/carnithine racemase